MEATGIMLIKHYSMGQINLKREYCLKMIIRINDERRYIMYKLISTSCDKQNRGIKNEKTFLIQFINLKNILSK